MNRHTTSETPVAYGHSTWHTSNTEYIRLHQEDMYPVFIACQVELSQTTRASVVAKDEINLPIALSAIRDKGSRLLSFGEKKKS